MATKCDSPHEPQKTGGAVARPVVLPRQGERFVGFTTHFTPKNATCDVEVSGFHTFDEGLSFYTMLDAFTPFLVRAGLRPPAVANALVILTPESDLVYAEQNFPIAMKVTAKKPFGAGEPVAIDDIARVSELKFPGIDPPPDSGFMLLLSHGWRRGMCFDFRSLHPPTDVTSAESFKLLQEFGAAVMSHLYYTEKFLLTPEDWNMVVAVGWFPFIALKAKTWEILMGTIRYGADLDEVEDIIHQEFVKLLDIRVDSWAKHAIIGVHSKFLKDAVDAYRVEKWASVVALALPRVEGMLREACGNMAATNSKFLDSLHEKLTEREHSRSLLFPDQLRRYFEEVVFPFTRFTDSGLPATRHTVAHGVVGYEELGRKQALTTLLLIDHLLYCIPSEPRDTEDSGASL